MRLKTGILVEEFFDKNLGGYGGYGFLARNYIAEYITRLEGIESKTILGFNDTRSGREIEVDGKRIIYLPNKLWKSHNADFIYYLRARKMFLRENFNTYLSIECPNIAMEVMRIDKSKKLLFWVQDSRPVSDWEEISTLEFGNEMRSFDSKNAKAKSDFLQTLVRENRVEFITQAKFLGAKAKELYGLGKDTKIDFIPNPITCTSTTSMSKDKKPLILFLGRLDSVKRPWIFFELARKMPMYEFAACGHCHNKELMGPVIEKYKDLKNLHLMGNVTGKDKDEILDRSWILVNTSIHEALPVSFLEGLLHRNAIVSCQNPDNLTDDYGYYTGKVIGNGYDKVDSFCEGIEYLIKNKEIYENKTNAGFKYVSQTHSVSKVMRELSDKLRSMDYGE